MSSIFLEIAWRKLLRVWKGRESSLLLADPNGSGARLTNYAPELDTRKTVLDLSFGNGIALAMPFPRFVSRSTGTWGVFPQGHRMCQSAARKFPICVIFRNAPKQSVKFRNPTFRLRQLPPLCLQLPFCVCFLFCTHSLTEIFFMVGYTSNRPPEMCKHTLF